MAFIQNGVRKPKFVDQIIISKKVKSQPLNFHSRTKGYSSFSVIEAIRAFIKGEIELEEFFLNVSGFTDEGIQKLKNLNYNFVVKSGKKNIDVYFTSTKADRYNIKLNVYFIEEKNVNQIESKKNNYDLSGDRIVLNKDSWFEDEEVFSQNHNIFFDQKEKKIIVAVHPDDVKELSEDKNMISILNEGVSVSNGIVSFTTSSEKVVVKDAKKRIENELAEKNKNRLVVEVKKSKSKNAIPVFAFEKGKQVNRHLNFINIDAQEIKNFKNGKYNIYDQLENKEFWFVVNDAVSFFEEKKEYMVIEKGAFKEKMNEIEEIYFIF